MTTVMDFKRKNKSQTSGTVAGIESGVTRLQVPHTTTNLTLRTSVGMQYITIRMLFLTIGVPNSTIGVPIALACIMN